MEPSDVGSRRSLSIGGVMCAIGGAVAVAGTLFELVSVEFALDARNHVTLTTTYFDTDDGKVVAAVGMVVLLVALATLVWQVPSSLPAIVLAGGGLAVFGFAVYDRFNIDSTIGDVTFGPALYVVMAGGVIAAIGGVLASSDG